MGRISRALATAAVGVVAASGLTVLGASPAAAGECSSSAALSILNQGRTTFWTRHDTTPTDNATANKNINQAASGLRAQLSPTQPHVSWTSVCLQTKMLNALYTIGSAWRLDVSELAGGTHGSPSSYHYQGRAFDIASINGVGVSGGNQWQAAVRQSCWNNGAVEVFGPGNAGHSTHIHCAF